MDQNIQQCLLNTYKRFSEIMVSGSGALLFDASAKEYLDCLAGIAVVSVGHANPSVTEAVTNQAKKLMHVSNYFWTEPGMVLAQKLNEITGGWGRVFFANSGAEANECAIKLVRKWASKQSSAASRYKIICAEKSFHGRTLATLAATGQPNKWKGFEPLPTGFVHMPYNDLQAFENAVDSQTAAILVEPIQGEGGVTPAALEFLRGLRELCNSKQIALIFDEVQSGMGRSGNWWAWQKYGVKPDLFTTAKALANGLPIGACIADEPFASAIVPGDHGSTFGGGPVVCAAALATIEFIEKNGFIDQGNTPGGVSVLSDYFKNLLQDLPHVKLVKGIGLLIGLVLQQEKAAEVVNVAFAKGLIINFVSSDIIRICPPFVISKEQIEKSVSILKQSIEEVFHA